MHEEAVGQVGSPKTGDSLPRLAADRDDEHFQVRILPGVSRTFALTIPQLPAQLNRAVTNAYLLCRIADTIEDDPSLTVGDKEHYLRTFLMAVAGIGTADKLAAELSRKLSETTLEAERELIAECPRVLRITHSLPDVQRTAIHRCLTIMSQGMARFERNRSRRGLADLDELERYCYCVAGVVGEMLTELFCSYSPEIERHREALVTYSTRFGQGLQMTNILKDIWDDLERGTCWLPREEFEASGFNLDQLRPGVSDPAFHTTMQRLVGVAHGCLRDALAYTLLIPRSEPGIRRFLMWAIGLASLTLRNIHSTPGFSSTIEVKVSRRNVKAVVTSTNIAICSNLTLKAMFDLASRGLSVESVHPQQHSANSRPSLSGD